jgi:prepilin-type N-terminal cleavage/methylation domain-containing protein
MRLPRVLLRRGTTLIEMLVSIVLLGLLAAVAAPAIRRAAAPPPNDPATIVAESLGVAIASARSITLQLTVGRQSALATVGSDGTVVADSSIHVDRFTGRRNDAP